MAFDLDNYQEVKERIPLFYLTYPEGRITTELLSEDSISCTVRAYLWKNAEEQGQCTPLSTGIAKEWDITHPNGSTIVKKYTENAETSAIGRAMANLSMFIGERPSREEMNAADVEAPKPKPKAKKAPPPPEDIEEHSLLEVALSYPDTELISQSQGGAIPVHQDGNPVYIVGEFRNKPAPLCWKHKGKGEFANEPKAMWLTKWDDEEKEGNENWKITRNNISDDSMYKCSTKDAECGSEDGYCNRLVTLSEFNRKHVAL